LTLVCRIVHMLSNNISSNSIVAITFTRKAANEMRDRIERVSKSLNIQTTLGLTICTFHQFCLKVLRLHSHLLTSDLKQFEVYTRRKQEDVLLRCFTEWNNQSNSQSQTSQGSQDQQP
jgi:superfamily I DNA/RNA helicase